MKDYLLNLNIILSSITIYSEIKNIRNKKKIKKNDLLNSLAINDQVMTIGGIIGTITNINDSLITLSSNENNSFVIHISAILKKV